MSSMPIRFARITDPDRRHAFYCAVQADHWDRFAAAYEKTPDMVLEPTEFADPRIAATAAAWLAREARRSGRPQMVMVGSAENGRWVNWNLPRSLRPNSPAL